MRTVLYCASMIAVTSCVPANARPPIARAYLGPPPSIVCTDRACASERAASQPARAVAMRREYMRRRGSYRVFTGIYERRRVREGSRQAAANERRELAPAHHHMSGRVVTIQTAANPITVSANIAGKMRALIDDLVAHGYRGHVTCLASGHMPRSLHHTGEACDFAQTSRNRVAAGAGIMYHASSIIAAHGLRDGCSFRDCGHFDSGRVNFIARAQYIPGGVARIRRYARLYYGHRFYRTAGPRYLQ